MIAVTGASGNLGRHVIEKLLETTVAADIVAIVRDPSKVADLSSQGVQVRTGDYSAPDTLVTALAGVEKLLLVSSNEMGKRAEHHSAVIGAAKTAGVSYIAYTSVLNADRIGVTVLKDHAKTEAEIRESGISFTFLRNGWYIENYTENLGAPLSMGAFFGAAGDGKVAAATRADFAAAAAAVLTGEGHEGKTYELAGDEGFTMADLAEAVSAWADKELPYNNLPADQYTQALVGAGLPDVVATFYTEADLAISRGELDSSSDDLHRLIGRNTTTLDEVLAGMPKPE